MLEQLDPEDKRKLHLEINQVVNQRFLISTLTLTVFAGVVALAFNLDTDAERSERVVLALSASMILFVLGMYLHSFFLRLMLRTFATYLRLVGASRWERDWRDYRKRGYFGYTKMQAVLFIILAVIATAFPCIFAALDDRTISYRCTTYGLYGSGFLAACLIYGIGFHGWFADEDKIEARWKETLGRPDPKAG